MFLSFIVFKLPLELSDYAKLRTFPEYTFWRKVVAMATKSITANFREFNCYNFAILYSRDAT